jgi:hypothetical protein
MFIFTPKGFIGEESGQIVRFRDDRDVFRGEIDTKYIGGIRVT